MDGEDFSIVFLPRLDGELLKPNIIELDCAITASYHDLILVLL